MFFEIILKVFGIVLLGYLIGRIRKAQLGVIIQKSTDFILYFVIPCFVFSAMLEKPFELLEFGQIVVAVAAIIVLMGLMVFFIAKLLKMEFRKICLPVIFMNSGNLALPLISLVLPAGLYMALIYNAAVGFLMFTIGIFLVSRKKGFLDIFGEPVLYATIVGTILNFMHVHPPLLLMDILKKIGLLAIPAMLLIMGYKMNFVRARTIKQSLWGTVLRIGGGFILSLVIVKAIGISGIARDVVILSSSMPSAIVSYIFAEKYDANPDFAASVVLVSTAVSIISIPLVLRFLGI
jgi:malate permease and related proteins